VPIRGNPFRISTGAIRIRRPGADEPSVPRATRAGKSRGADARSTTRDEGSGPRAFLTIAAVWAVESQTRAATPTVGRCAPALEITPQQRSGIVK